jgi:hypothetical protein
MVTLPDGICSLGSLEKLDLRWNKLSSLPEGFDGLEARGCAVLR